MLRALIVEDQPAVAQALEVLLEVHEVPCAVARGAEEALRRVEGGGFGVVLTDMNFRPGATDGAEGAALFRELRRLDPSLPVLLMTAWTSLPTAVQLVREGAADYFGKPWDDAKLVASVRRLLELSELRAQAERTEAERLATRAELAERHDLRGLVYESDALHRLVALAVRVAPADVPVLITGPSGSGKEKVAEIVQANSRRRDRPFLKVNAGALPDDLLEAELFGAEAGAYTGAQKLRIGRLEAANGGTLFLDEIGNLSLAGQAKLLRALQSGEFTRLGSSETRRTDVRVLCATNADLPRLIEDGRFREDLYFRLNVIELHVPPLGERPADVLPLARHALASLAPRATLSPAAERALLAHPWPGNVRELLNRIQRAALLARSDEIGADDLGFEVSTDPSAGAGTGSPGTPSEGPAPGPGPAPPADPERDELQALLLAHGGSVSRAAAARGLSRQALYRRMERLGIVLERRPRDG